MKPAKQSDRETMASLKRKRRFERAALTAELVLVSGAAFLVLLLGKPDVWQILAVVAVMLLLLFVTNYFVGYYTVRCPYCQHELESSAVVTGRCDRCGTEFANKESGQT